MSFTPDDLQASMDLLRNALKKNEEFAEKMQIIRAQMELDKLQKPSESTDITSL